MDCIVAKSWTQLSDFHFQWIYYCYFLNEFKLNNLLIFNMANVSSDFPHKEKLFKFLNHF